MYATQYFSDLHSFKDFIGFVAMCLPNDFPDFDEPEEDKLNLETSFNFLYKGILLAKQEKGNKPVFDECAQLIEQAYVQYKNGDDVAGFKTLDLVRKKISKIRTE